MIVVADINTLWRRKPFEALSEWLPVLGLAPRDILSVWNKPVKPHRRDLLANFYERSTTMPPGWASRFPEWTARRLWATATRISRTAERRLTALVVTSPHYLPLVKRAQPHVPTFYYCSDDYAQYTGWGGTAMLQREAETVRAVTHSFFVSDVLAERAVRNYSVSSEKVSVSPNATEEAFLTPVSEDKIQALLTRFPRLGRPLVGVVGAVNERLNFDLLLECVALPGVGTLVIVGPVPNDLRDSALARLKDHSRCVFVGSQPHAELPTWMQMLDVALIPYRDTALNRSCSPMRLFDHLAAGRPIVATDFCRQVAAYSNVVEVADREDDFVSKLAARLDVRETAAEVAARREIARDNLWSNRAQLIAARLASSRP